MGIASIAVDLLEISETGEDARSEASVARSETIVNESQVSTARSEALAVESEVSIARSETIVNESQVSTARSEALAVESEVSAARSDALVNRSHARLGESEALEASEAASKAESEAELADPATVSAARSVGTVGVSEAVMASDTIKDSAILSVPVSEEYRVLDIRRDSAAQWIFRYDTESVA